MKVHDRKRNGRRVMHVVEESGFQRKGEQRFQRTQRDKVKEEMGKCGVKQKTARKIMTKMQSFCFFHSSGGVCVEG